MLVADVNNILEIAQKVEEIWSKLNTQRTVLIRLENRTPFALRVETHHHSHGGFGVPPDIEVPPRSVSLFGSQSKAGSIATGTEGSVTYVAQGTPMYVTLHWNNPFVGPNKCSASVAGASAAAFEAKSISGSGHDANMKYELRQLIDPRFVRVPDYRFVRLEGYILRPDLVSGPNSPSPLGTPIIGLSSYWSPSREDNFATTNPAFLHLAKLEPDYNRYRLEGYLFAPTAPPPAGTIALRSWWSPSRGDNFATTNSAYTQPLRERLLPDYGHYRLEGYLYPPDGPQPKDTVPLYSWYSHSRGDNFISSNPQYHP